MERHGLSQRHVCRLVGIDRSTLRYQCKRADDSTLRQRLRELAAERRRFGYRRLGWMLARRGHTMNHKKLYRLYREEKLSLCRRGYRKRAVGTRTPMRLPTTINQRWSLDFVMDTLSDGRHYRILCIVDDFNRECLAAVVDTWLGGTRVVRELERLVSERAIPEIIVSDNGTELTSAAVLQWASGRTAGDTAVNASPVATPPVGAPQDPSKIPLIPQDLTKREYFGSEVPKNGHLCWDLPAQQILDFVRACDFFSISVTLGSPAHKIDGLGTRNYKSSEDMKPVQALAGTVGRATNSGVEVACRDEWILVRKVVKEGKVFQAEAVLRPGDRLQDCTAGC